MEILPVSVLNKALKGNDSSLKQRLKEGFLFNLFITDEEIMAVKKILLYVPTK